MSNRKSDAETIVGPELAELVERLFQEEKVERTEAAELVIRSLEQAAKVEKTDDWRDLLEDLDKAELLQLLYKLSDDGKLTVDGLAAEISAMLNATTDRTKEDSMADETKVDVPVEKTDAETPVEVAKDVEIWKPYGGANSMEQATEYLKSLKMEDAVYRVFNVFMGVAQNIMSSDENVESRMEQMSKLLNDCQKMLTPENLMTFSQNREVTVDLSKLDTVLAKLEELQKPAEITRTALHPVVEKFNSEFENAVALYGEERLATLQNLLGTIGNEFTEVHRSLLEKEQMDNPVQKPQITTSDIETVVRSTVGGLQNDVSQLTQQVSQLAQIISGLQVANAPVQPKVIRPTPVQKSLTVQAPSPVQQIQRTNPNGKGLSIAEIVKRTVYNG